MTGWRHRAWPVADVRAAEGVLLAGLPDGVPMQRAAAGLARRCALLLADRGGVYGARVLLLVGTGDNGGDALYAGARLARRGARVEALVGDRCHAGGLAALRAAGGRVVPPGGGSSAAGAAGPVDDAGSFLDGGVTAGGVDLVVDGLLGIGGRGGLRAEARALADRAAAARADGAVVVAVDLPSGVDADTGAVDGDAVTADVTVTFGCLKPGLLVGDGARRAGLVELVDIGLGPHLTARAALGLVTLDVVRARWPRPGAGDDKYTRGVVGVATGSAVYPGAAVLSTGGALAGPTGYVRYAGAAADAVRAAHPEVVSTDDVAGAGRVQAWVVGSGLGTDDAAERVVRRVLDSDVPVLLDADAITVVARHPEWVRDRSAPVVLTPHDREFARIAGEVGVDRVGAARRAAADLGAVVLLKGAHTVVAAPPGGGTAGAGEPDVHVVTSGVSDLASAGTGDVLSGLLGSLLAAGLPAAEAAAHAAFVHGLAGRFAAAEGPVSAARVVDALREAVRVVRADG